MRILLDQQEIQTALEAFVETMGLQGATGVSLSVNGDEIQAEIIMNGVISKPTHAYPSSDSTSTETTDQPRKRGGRVPGSKNKPKGDSNVATTSEAGSDLSSTGTAEAGEDEDSGEEAEGDSVTEGSKLDLFGESLFDGDQETHGLGSDEPTLGSQSNRGNPSGVSDNESSEDTDPDDEGSDTETKAAPVTTDRKRPSIFDAD